MLAGSLTAALVWGVVAGPAGAADPSAAALVVRGVQDYRARAMRSGTEQLERAVALRPGWSTARASLATALFRNGAAGSAVEQFEALIGVGTARDLASGALQSAALQGPVDPNHVLGLAMSLQQLGRTREAERLYRCAADLLGPTSKESGRAYFLLAQMLSERGLPWSDHEAELAKALAVDAGVAGRDVLPPFPDLAADPELEPYTWPVTAARADSSRSAPETLPRLAEWPPAVERAAPAFTGAVTVEALVLPDGSVGGAEVVAPAEVSEELREAAVRAVSAARFDPALGADGFPMDAWVAIAVPGRVISGEPPSEPGHRETP